MYGLYERLIAFNTIVTDTITAMKKYTPTLKPGAPGPNLGSAAY